MQMLDNRARMEAAKKEKVTMSWVCSCHLTSGEKLWAGDLGTTLDGWMSGGSQMQGVQAWGREAVTFSLNSVMQVCSEPAVASSEPGKGWRWVGGQGMPTPLSCGVP